MTNKEKSLKAILKHKKFNYGNYFKSDKSNCICCAIGYALRANGFKNGSPKHKLLLKDPELMKITGFTQHQISKIIELNDYSKVEKLKDYCKGLLQQC